MFKFLKILIVAIIVYGILFLTGCQSMNVTTGNRTTVATERDKAIENTDTDNNEHMLNLNKDEISKINISTAPPLFQAFDITDREQFSNVVDYLTSLNVIETKLDPLTYLGMAYSVKIRLKDGSERVFSLSGNKFFREKDRFTYEIPYEEATKFDTLVANILESMKSKSGEYSIEGTVISIKSEASGRNVSCVIKDKDNTDHDIYVKDASIIDASGNGWMILHKNDIIRVFYKEKDDGGIDGSMVFIHKAAQ